MSGTPPAGSQIGFLAAARERRERQRRPLTLAVTVEVDDDGRPAEFVYARHRRLAFAEYDELVKRAQRARTSDFDFTCDVLAASCVALYTVVGGEPVSPVDGGSVLPDFSSRELAVALGVDPDGADGQDAVRMRVAALYDERPGEVNRHHLAVLRFSGLVVEASAGDPVDPLGSPPPPQTGGTSSTSPAG